MESLGKLQLNQQPIRLSLTQSSSSFPQHPTSLSLRRSTWSFKGASVRASSSKPQDSIVPVLQSTCITFTAAAALFLANLHHKPLPAIAAPRAGSSEHYSILDIERSIEGYLASHPRDVVALRGLVEVRIKSRKPIEAIEGIDRLMKLEPKDKGWLVLKAIVIFSHSGDLESAKSGFEAIIAKHGLRVEAYHGLAMAYSDSGDDLNALEKRTQKDKYKDFKLVRAQMKVLEGEYNEGLEMYQELVKEEPRDFRPYLCQVMIYMFLKKQDEAEKQFDKFRKLVPRNHPYRESFVDNMDKVQREMA